MLAMTPRKSMLGGKKTHQKQKGMKIHTPGCKWKVVLTD